MTDILLSENPDRELFNSIAEYLEKELHISFTMKLSGLDQCYWDFSLNNQPVTLHLEHFTGITLTPSSSGPVSEETYKLLHFVSDLIKKKFQLS